MTGERGDMIEREKVRALDEAHERLLDVVRAAMNFERAADAERYLAARIELDTLRQELGL